MKEFKVYSDIQQLKHQCYSKSTTAMSLEISRNTVARYWDMTPEAFDRRSIDSHKTHVLNDHEPLMLAWLREHPGISAAQVHDWLLEHRGIKSSERTTRRVVSKLREVYDIPRRKAVRPRDYEAIELTPMGKQMQVDFGQKHMRSSDGKSTLVHFAAFVLSHSKYKWGFYQERPFTTLDLIRSLEMCFEFMGGKPLQLVFDQDSIVSVNENYGDIIFTKAFEQYKQAQKLQVYLCRKADPESKGAVENVVKYFKNNFLAHRYYMGIDILNRSFEDWLERTGNGKVHGTTKKIPAEVFEVESAHLRPVPITQTKVCSDSITRKVRKDNTVLYESNRYSVPLGTYHKEKEVELVVEGDRLSIRQVFGDYVIAEHRIASGKGQLVKNTSHRRNNEQKLEVLYQALSKELHDACNAYLQELRSRKPRYFRDQCELIRSLIGYSGADVVIGAIRYCEQYELYSATDVRDALKYLTTQNAEIPSVASSSPPLLHHGHLMEVVTQKRPIQAYVDAGGDL